jgi:hypothetical protein
MTARSRSRHSRCSIWFRQADRTPRTLLPNDVAASTGSAANLVDVPVVRDGEKPSPYVGSRPPEMQIGQGPRHAVLDEVLGVGLNYASRVAHTRFSLGRMAGRSRSRMVLGPSISAAKASRADRGFSLCISALVAIAAPDDRARNVGLWVRGLIPDDDPSDVNPGQTPPNFVCSEWTRW